MGLRSTSLLIPVTCQTIEFENFAAVTIYCTYILYSTSCILYSTCILYRSKQNRAGLAWLVRQLVPDHTRPYILFALN